MRTTTPLDVDLSGIAVIDGLQPAERWKYEDSRKLRELIRSVEPGWLGPVYCCDSKYSYLDALRDLAQRATNGEYYLVHYECHGCPDGLEMDADLVTWAEQHDGLAKLNNAMKGRLVLDLSACNGIYATKMAGLDPLSPPFYAVIGPAKRVRMDCASVITKAFYDEYLSGPAYGKLNEAITRANQRLKLDVIKGIRAKVFIEEQQAGYPFRPNSPDQEEVECLPDGSVRVRR